MWYDSSMSEKSRRTVTLDIDVEDEARVAAAVERISTSAFINRAVRKYLADRKQSKPAKETAA
jgi:hypothetical protein